MVEFPLNRNSVIVETDDFNVACNVAIDLHLSLNGTQFYTLAQWFATSRVYYVEIGKQLTLDTNLKP